jgi:hypothetical protein
MRTPARPPAPRTLLLLLLLLAFPAHGIGAGQERDPAVAEATDELRVLDLHVEARPEDVPARVQRLRLLYFLAIDDSSRLDPADRAIDELRDRTVPDEIDVTLDAYRAALEVLRGKHATWPWSKLSHLRNGLGAMDDAVRRAPGHVELRYLRLVSGFYLPAIFGRSDAVHEDLQVLERRLPSARREFPPSTFAGMAAFVLENGPSEGPDVEPLARALARAEEEAREELEPGPRPLPDV